MSNQLLSRANKKRSSVLQRLITINTIVIALALLLICGFIYVKEYYSTISRQISSLSSLGEIISDRLTGVMAFEDFDLAQKSILTLKKNQDILAACIYDKNKTLLTSFENHENEHMFCSENDHLITSLMIEEEILLDGESLGQLVLYSNPQRVTNQMLATLGYLFLVAVICYILSLMLAKRFIRKETQPIIDLANTARQISNTGDYEHRVEKGFTPAQEISNLIDSFNELLDIVARHNNELETLISERTNQLEEEKQKVEIISQAKSEFLAKLSHDLRTPLTSILGYSEILSAQKNLQDNQATHLDVIIRNAEFITQLVNNLLELSKLESANLKFDYEVFDVKKLVDNLENTFVPTALTRNLDLIVEFSRLESQRLMGDVTKLQQILNNLLENALKFTTSGFVSLTVSQRQLTDKQVMNTFVVADSGIGISADKIDRIFDDYVQLESNAYSIKGAGLGLAITKKLVDLMGGRLEVESDQNTGTVFTLELPLDSVQTSPQGLIDVDESERTNTAVISPDTSVLIVDDDPGCREILLSIVSEYVSPRQIYQAETLTNATEILEEHQTELIFLDIELPDGNGFEFAKKIREQYDNIIIIAVSAFNDEKRELQLDLIDAFVPKPFSKFDITTVLGQLRSE